MASTGCDQHLSAGANAASAVDTDQVDAGGLLRDLFDRAVGQRRWSATPGRADRLVVAPVAQRPRARPPVARLQRPGDRASTARRPCARRRADRPRRGRSGRSRRCRGRPAAASTAPRRAAARAPARRTSSGTAPSPRRTPTATGRSCSRPPGSRPVGATSRRSTYPRRVRPDSSSVSTYSSRSAGSSAFGSSRVKYLPSSWWASASHLASSSPSASSANSSATSGSAASTCCHCGSIISAACSRVRWPRGRSKSRSSTPCTTVPRTAADDGFSGSRSITRNRYLSGQLMKSAARDGDNAPCGWPCTSTAAATLMPKG